MRAGDYERVINYDWPNYAPCLNRIDFVAILSCIEFLWQREWKMEFYDKKVFQIISKVVKNVF